MACKSRRPEDNQKVGKKHFICAVNIKPTGKFLFMKKTELFKIARAIFGFCIVFSFGFSVKAGPISFGTHYYEFVYAPLVSWETAREAAATNSFMGVNGHLAVVLSGAENDFLRENFAPTRDLRVRGWGD